MENQISENAPATLAPAPEPLSYYPQTDTSQQAVLRDEIIAAIKTVYDPEIPVNIYDLGLIYDIGLGLHAIQGARVQIRMTLTSPNCPVAGTLPGDVQRKVESVETVTAADIELTFDPPWEPSRMSDAARLDLGMM